VTLRLSAFGKQRRFHCLHNGREKDHRHIADRKDGQSFSVAWSQMTVDDEKSEDLAGAPGMPGRQRHQEEQRQNLQGWCLHASAMTERVEVIVSPPVACVHCAVGFVGLEQSTVRGCLDGAVRMEEHTRSLPRTRKAGD
jgi:hypothetical protein